MIFLVISDYAFLALTDGRRNYNSALILYFELRENPWKGTHEIHWPGYLLKEF